MIIAHSAMIPRRGGESGNMPSDSGNKNRLLPDYFFHQTTLTGLVAVVTFTIYGGAT
jgi:hypothetical protein